MSDIAKCIICGYYTDINEWKKHRIENTNDVKCPDCGGIIKCPWWTKKRIKKDDN